MTNCLCTLDGLSLPTEEWQKTITESIQQVQQLELDYEADLIAKKVNFSFLISSSIISKASNNASFRLHV